MSYQLIVLVGYVGRVNETRTTTSGTQVVSFSVAVNERVGDSDTVEWFDCTAWGKLAEIVGAHVTKGKLVAVEGRRATREYTNKDGQAKVTQTVRVNTLRLLGPKQSGGEQERGADASNRAAPVTAASQPRAPAFNDDDIPF